MKVEEIRKERQRQGMSVWELSRKSGISLIAVQKIIDGRTNNPRYATLRALEAALKER